ncbi:NAD(P)/FAD-dependent oxidoreductase [Rhodococcus olei]|uniref:NAD(P)/FAD-dependent oxidoreductase n=1 Tax=Rhodococcus olei TaxID=2161675 RepID=A0ABP8NYB7_9NOCA
MTNVIPELDLVVEKWLDRFEAALTSQDALAIGACFVTDSHWRDVLAFTWNLVQTHGASAIGEGLAKRSGQTGAHHFRLNRRWGGATRATVFTRDVVQGIFDFDTGVGVGTGVVRLVEDPDSPIGYSAWLLLTSQQTLNAPGVTFPDERSERYGFTPSVAGETWLENREYLSRFEDREPQVLVVGAGHAGVSIAARLERMGVDTLVVEKSPRVGDVWRNRYRSLALHNPTGASHFPYIPYPSHWPQYLSKDQVANFIETYAQNMDLKIWTSSEFIHGTYDEETSTWTATIRRADGETRTLRPQHIVMAAGVTGKIPNIPDLPGIRDFKGEVIHTSQFDSGEAYQGKKVLVVGAATSAHDAALELHFSGARPTMLQRGPLTVVRLSTVEKYDFAGLPPQIPMEKLELIDLIGLSNLVFPLMREEIQRTATKARAEDADLIEGLKSAGMKVYNGEDDGGWKLAAWRTASGYYIDVGASDHVVNGDIAVRQAETMTRFVEDGIELTDGSIEQYDAVILATGYHNIQVDLARMFGDEIGKRLDGIFNLRDKGSGEFSNSWAPTNQPGLWFNVGGFPQTRAYSYYLALQIKARVAGLVPRDAHIDSGSMQQRWEQDVAGYPELDKRVSSGAGHA